MPGPDLNLNVVQPNSTGMFGANPVGAMTDLMRMRLMGNENQMFQQEFQAKQLAGQIIATSPDDQTSVERMKADPRIAPWVPQLESTLLSNSATLANIALEKQHTTQSQAETTLAGTRNVEAATAAGRNVAETGLIGANTAARWNETGQSVYSRVLSDLAPAIADPSSFEKWYGASTSSVPNSVLDANGGVIRKSLSNIHDVLAPLAQSDPAAFQRQLNAALLRTGMSPEATAAAAGTVLRQFAPGTGPGAFLIGGPGQPNQAAPAQAGAGNPLLTQPTGVQTQGNQIAPSSGTGPASGPASASAPLHPDGTPLYAPASMLPKPVMSPLNGMPARDPTLQASIENQLTRWNAEQPKYDAAAQASAKLEEQGANIETLAKNGGWLQPGPGAAFRLGLGQLVNLAASIIHPGEPLPVDTTKLASGQSAIKDTTLLGFGLAAQNFGEGREPLGLINNALNAVPGIDNTALGGLLVRDMLKASTDWVSAQRDFKQNWLDQTSGPTFAGNLTGSDAAYAKLHPPSALIKPILDKYGLGSDGFKTEAAATQQYKDGLINGKIYYTELHNKGWITDKVFERNKAAGFPSNFGTGEQ